MINVKFLKECFRQCLFQHLDEVSLAVGRGEKLPASKGAGLTAKGRAKYNRAHGSNLKAPVTGKVKKGSKAAKRRKSFCARMRGVVKKSKNAERARASLRRWKCGGVK
jgi:hypothetical protein